MSILFTPWQRVCGVCSVSGGVGGTQMFLEAHVGVFLLKRVSTQVDLSWHFFKNLISACAWSWGASFSCKNREAAKTRTTIVRLPEVLIDLPAKHVWYVLDQLWLICEQQPQKEGVQKTKESATYNTGISDPVLSRENPALLIPTQTSLKSK